MESLFVCARFLRTIASSVFVGKKDVLKNQVYTTKFSIHY